MWRTIYIPILFLALLVHKTSAGQGGLPQMVIKDKENGRPVAEVHVQEPVSATVRLSNKDGVVPLEGWDLPVVLHLSHIGYEDLQVKVTLEDLDESGRTIVQLQPRMVMLDPVEITRPAPEVVYQRDDLHVGAYHVNSDGLWVLVYDKPQLFHRQENAGQQVLKGARLHLLDTLFQERAQHAFNERVKGLHRDHLYRVIVECESRAWLAEEQKGVIAFAEVDLETLHKAILPWKDTIAGALLGNDLQEYYPAFDHLAYDPVTGDIRSICRVEDEFLVELFRSQYKYMSGREKVIAMDLAVETGMDSEDIAGHMTGFHKNLYYRIPYAPLFVVGDTVCVFDHYKERIRKFDLRLEEVGEVPMQYHKERSWKNGLLQDPASGRIYSFHKRANKIFLHPIDITTGGMGPAITLTHPFPEEVKVFDGHVYYVYRPFGSLQHRTLYRERLY